MMNILTSTTYEKQLKELLEVLVQQDYQFAKNFKMYLDTIIINIETKIEKYKKSIYFDDENIKDIEYQGCVIPFLIDKKKNNIILLGISSKS